MIFQFEVLRRLRSTARLIRCSEIVFNLVRFLTFLLVFMVDDIAFVGIVATPFHAVEPKLEFTTDDFAVAVFFGNAEHATKLNRIADDQLRIRILTRIHLDQFFE